MYKIRAAEINIAVYGADCPLFDERLGEYFADFESPCVTVFFENKDFIPQPEGERLGSRFYRTWQKTPDGFACFDTLCGEYVTALWEFDKDVSRVCASLRKIDNLGGAADDVRKFNMLGEIFRLAALGRGKCVIHAAAVLSDLGAAAFSAPAGTGKSTHAALWEKYFGAKTINDDSPAVGFGENGAVIYGTPWSGKTAKNAAASAPLRALFFIERGDAETKNLSDAEKAFRIISELPVPPIEEFADRYISFAERLVKSVPMCILRCDISQKSALTARDFYLNPITKR